MASASIWPARWPASCFEVDQLGAFFDIIHQDPILSQVKLIAEPWDVGAGRLSGRQFPGAVDRVERQVSRHACGASGRATADTLSEFATRLSGSSDLYQDDGRKPYASINFITCHDGFTLHDLVSYNDKHNEANGEDNHDGANDNNSWNCGAEGPTDDPAINALRGQQKRNFIATLFLSQGVPMLLAGDELSHTQQGNNNTYCQDNELTWLNWDVDRRAAGLSRLCARRDASCSAPSRSFSAASSSRAAPFAARTSRTSPGSSPPARK